MVERRMPVEALTGGQTPSSATPSGPSGAPPGAGGQEGQLALLEALMQIPFFRDLIMKMMQAKQGGAPQGPPGSPPSGPPPQGPSGSSGGSFSNKLRQLQGGGR